MDNHKARISYKTLKSNLVNLPSSLTNLLFTANIQVQDVIIEMVTTTSNGNKRTLPPLNTMLVGLECHPLIFLI